MTISAPQHQKWLNEFDLHVTSITLLALVVLLVLGSDSWLASLPDFSEWQYRLLWLFALPQGRLLVRVLDQQKKPGASAWRSFVINEIQVMIALVLALGYLSI
jgi:uncharacterized membrane protein